MHTRDQNADLPEIAAQAVPQVGQDRATERTRLNSQSPEPSLMEQARLLLIGTVAVCLLLSVGLFNGYPTIFSDTGSYLLTGAFFVAFVPFRAPGYSMFMTITGMGISSWFIIVAQATIVVYVLYEACDYLVDRDRTSRDFFLLGGVCGLTALTSLPWLVSLLMPDVFAGVLFLSAFLLTFTDNLHSIRRILLAAIFAFSVSAHSSFLPIAAVLVAAVAVLTFTIPRLQIFAPKKSVLAWLLVPIMVAGLWTANLNREMGLGFRLAPSRNMFLLAKLFGNGLAADYLRENCPARPLISCRYLSNLPQTPEQFLFWHPLVHDLDGHEDEMATITRGTIRSYPIRFIADSARDTLLQFASLRTGDEIRTYGAGQWNNTAIEQVFPGDFQAMSNDRQFHGRLLPVANAIAPIHTVIFWLSFAACLFFARTGRFEKVNVFLYFAIVFLVANAAISGTFAGVYDRYQSRVAWIVPLCLTAYICCLAKEWKRGDATSFAEVLTTCDADAIPPGNS